MKRMVSRFRRWKDRRREAKSLYTMSERDWMLLNGSTKYRLSRPYIYGVIGRRED